MSKEYLEYWTCDHCGEHTHEVDYDYLGNGTNHLECELKLEKIMETKTNGKSNNGVFLTTIVTNNRYFKDKDSCQDKN